MSGTGRLITSAEVSRIRRAGKRHQWLITHLPSRRANRTVRLSTFRRTSVHNVIVRVCIAGRSEPASGRRETCGGIPRDFNSHRDGSNQKHTLRHVGIQGKES